jgi:hypothetical protein
MAIFVSDFDVILSSAAIVDLKFVDSELSACGTAIAEKRRGRDFGETIHLEAKIKINGGR